MTGQCQIWQILAVFGYAICVVAERVLGDRCCARARGLKLAGLDSVQGGSRMLREDVVDSGHFIKRRGEPPYM